MKFIRLAAATVALASVAGCADSSAPLPTAGSHPSVNVADPATATAEFDRAPDAPDNGNLEASGEYRFFVPADYHGGIFGGAIDNRVEFEAHRSPKGKVTGRFHYIQVFDGEPVEFSGRLTCLAIYDTPVLANFPAIPAMTHNRAKWGGVIERSTDPTQPPGRYIWFQSIDNDVSHEKQARYADLSTLSGFGDNAANEAFCASANVPNPNFGPHAVTHGGIEVH